MGPCTFFACVSGKLSFDFNEFFRLVRRDAHVPARDIGDVSLKSVHRFVLNSDTSGIHNVDLFEADDTLAQFLLHLVGWLRGMPWPWLVRKNQHPCSRSIVSMRSSKFRKDFRCQSRYGKHFHTVSNDLLGTMLIFQIPVAEFSACS